MMNNKGRAVVSILIVMIVIVLTSAVILSLVRFGVIEVPKVETESAEPILNTEFIPLERSGSLAVKDFQFCSFVDDEFECYPQEEFKNGLNEFRVGDSVYFRFAVESSTSQGKVYLIENYKLKDSDGNVLLDVAEENNYYFEYESKGKMEEIVFSDYFVVDANAAAGKYNLDLVIKNPLLEKTVILTKSINIVEGEGI